jgi:translation initiation factor IF-2
MSSRNCFLSFTTHSSKIYNLRTLKSSIKLTLSGTSALDDIFHLINPLVVVNIEAKSQSSVISSLETETHTGLISLNLKPSLKIDKKVKKNEKDEDRDLDRSTTKIKVKKKTRSKVSFDEEYESVSEFFETDNISEDISLLPLARPAKPITTEAPTFSFTVKQKGQGSTPTKKKKSSNSSLRKEMDALSSKPEKINLKQPVTVQELSDVFKVSKIDIIRSLFLKGISVTVNQLIDLLTAQKLGEEFGIEVNLSSETSPLTNRRIDNNKTKSENSISRPPIITIMGHVDHGKTTLLDKIRKTQTAQKEAGGITQRIGAYEVFIEHKNESRKLVFLDTPGHAAFSGMRSRGVSLTDIAILVVAADDGVKPQTLEAIQYIQSANVPIIVAINKIDKEDANVETIKEELSKHNLISEDWGGDTLMVPISAMQGTNVDTLLEMVILLSDVLGLEADPSDLAEGTVIESHLDRTRGAIASILIQNGTLHVGDVITVGNQLAKVRGMLNSLGETISEASPSSPVIIWGLSKVPSVGDTFSSFRDEKEAKLSLLSSIELNLSSNMTQSLSDNYTVSDSENKKRVNLIIKTDSQGSSEAINSILNKIDNPKVQLRILYSSAGEVTETDVEFAMTSNSSLLAFNTTSASGAKKAAKNFSILIKEFDVIYDLLEYVETLIENLVGPQYEERFIGAASVKTVFPLAKSFVAGSIVTEGKIIKGSFIQIFRGNDIVHTGFITSLKRMKEDVVDVLEGTECGIFVNEFDSWKSGDILKAFELIVKKKGTF